MVRDAPSNVGVGDDDEVEQVLCIGLRERTVVIIQAPLRRLRQGREKQGATEPLREVMKGESHARTEVHHPMLAPASPARDNALDHASSSSRRPYPRCPRPRCDLSALSSPEWPRPQSGIPAIAGTPSSPSISQSTSTRARQELAVELAQSAEEIHDLLVPFMEWEPAFRTQVVLVDPTDSANGYATTIPHNTIVIYAAPPTPESSLDNYEHWLWAIFVHEYAHILQIDEDGGSSEGTSADPRSNDHARGVLPRWMTEGFATWVETRFSAGGRGRSTYTDMLLRSAALEGKLPRIDTADGLGHRWPSGHLRYLYGARFHFEVAERSGKGPRGVGRLPPSSRTLRLPALSPCEGGELW